MALSKTHLKDVCLLGMKYHQCRYLDEAENDDGEVVYVCRRKTADGKAIDDELNDYVKDLKKQKKDPRDSEVPLGDNCSGYPALPNVKQGYDV
jgi:hypothetical protein